MDVRLLVALLRVDEDLAYIRDYISALARWADDGGAPAPIEQEPRGPPSSGQDAASKHDDAPEAVSSSGAFPCPPVKLRRRRPADGLIVLGRFHILQDFSLACLFLRV